MTYSSQDKIYKKKKKKRVIHLNGDDHEKMWMEKLFLYIIVKEAHVSIGGPYLV